MLNNLGPAFKTYLTVINNRMQTDQKLEKNKVLFKAIKEEDSHIKAKYKAFTNFAIIKSNAKSQEGAIKEKKEFVK